MLSAPVRAIGRIIPSSSLFYGSNRTLSAVFRLLRRSRTAACRQWVKTLDTLFSLLYNLLALMHVGVCLQYFLSVINSKQLGSAYNARRHLSKNTTK